MIAEQNLSSSKSIFKSSLFRFSFVYWMLYIWPFPLYFIPFSDYVLLPITQGMSWLINLSGPFFFGEHFVPENDGSDTSLAYTRCFVFLILALVGAIIWTLARKFRSDNKWFSIVFNVLIRYYLASKLLDYGFSKFFPLQFPPLTPDRLSTPSGEVSHMGLLWIFMSASKGYAFFSGVGEILAAILLLFRKTRLLGAVISVFVMSNVFALNIFYDVSVKLFSFHLLIMSLVLIVPDLRKLINIFILNRATESENIALPLSGKNVFVARMILKVIVIFFFVNGPVNRGLKALDNEDAHHARANTGVIGGEFEIESFVINGDTLGNSSDETRRWKKIRIGGRSLEITSMDGMSISWYCTIRPGSRKFLISSKDLSTQGEFRYDGSDSLMMIRGKLNQDSIAVTSRKISDDVFRLQGQEFHWVSEEPNFY